MDKLMSVHLNTSPLGLSPLSIIPTCIMTAGDYLCQRKTRHFKTPAPLRDQSPSPCAHAHVQHLQSIAHFIITCQEDNVRNRRPVYAK